MPAKGIGISPYITTKKKGGGFTNPKFIFTIDTTLTSPGGSASNQFKLALRAGQTYNCLIEWGDGTTTTQTTATSPTHTYPSTGIYQVKISGTFASVNISNNNSNDRLKWKSIDNWGSILWAANQASAFRGCSNMKILASDRPIFSFTSTSLASFFSGCSSLNENINNWDVSNVTNMASMFESCSSFNQSLNNWNFAKCVLVSRMFAGCNTFNQPINFSLPLCQDISEILQSCTNYNSSVIITNLNNCIAAVGAFSLLPIFNSPVTLSGTAGINDWRGIFGLSPMFNQPVNFDTSGAVNLSEFFNGCTAFNSSVTFSSTSNCTQMNSMFLNCSAFNQNVNYFDVSKVTQLDQMFNGCTAFNQPLNNWTLNTTNPVGVNMNAMFYNATAFNQDISSWDISNVNYATGFMDGKTSADYSSSNYDALLNGWATKASLTWAPELNMGEIKYTASGAAARATLIGTYGWTISDGGI